jgi:hypothetical protein
MLALINGAYGVRMKKIATVMGCAACAKGFAIHPRKLTIAEPFRIGCVGHIGAAEIGVASGAPSLAVAVSRKGSTKGAAPFLLGLLRPRCG